jgi:Lon protease-like protein
LDQFIPVFPLNLVVFPGEKLNLHIFEPRYKQLVNECLKTGQAFGIIPYINNKLSNLGTFVQITQLARRYEDGRMDIKTMGTDVFSLRIFENPAPGKLYAHAAVDILEKDSEGSYKIDAGLWQLIVDFFDMIDERLDIHFENIPYASYEIAHKVGLSNEQKLTLLGMELEKDRQAFLYEHLKLTLPIMRDIAHSKQIIRMNGHFKHIDPLNF